MIQNPIAQPRGPCRALPPDPSLCILFACRGYDGGPISFVLSERDAGSQNRAEGTQNRPGTTLPPRATASCPAFSPAGPPSGCYWALLEQASLEPLPLANGGREARGAGRGWGTTPRHLVLGEVEGDSWGSSQAPVTKEGAGFGPLEKLHEPGRGSC